MVAIFLCLIPVTLISSKFIQAQRLPTAFTGIVQVERVAKKGESNTAPHSPIVEGCFNQHECCYALYTLGQCVHHHSDMKIWCPGACGFCRPTYDPELGKHKDQFHPTHTFSECADRHVGCERMAAAGKCIQFEYFMDENCRRSCGRCDKRRTEICREARHDCSEAPTPGLRKYCEQLQRWDQEARVRNTISPIKAIKFFRKAPTSGQKSPCRQVQRQLPT